MHAGTRATPPRRVRFARLLARPVATLGSLRLAVPLLALLLLLTLLGTFEQAHASAFAVQQGLFGAWWVLREFGGVPLPLPGGALLLPLLALNLAVGGVLRLRRGRATLGILVIHLGVLLLLGGGIVDGLFSAKGQLTLFEQGRGGPVSGDTYRDSHRWELRISELRADGPALVWALPGERFLHMPPGVRGTFRHAALPFAFTLTDPMLDARPVADAAARPGDGPAVDGVRLRPQPPGTDDSLDVAGVRALVDDPADGSTTPLLLTGLHDAPVTFQADGRRWSFELGHVRYALPFTVTLEDFRRELHPGLGLARSFESTVTLADEHGRRTARIAMNQPLRQAGFTLFQSGWGPEGAPDGAPLFSTFSVVRNPAEGVPIVACVVIALGLLLHFVPRLSRRLGSDARDAPARAPRVLPWALALLLAVLGLPLLRPLLFPPDAASRSWPPATLELLAQLPVQEGGRVKPLSSVARFRLLALSGKRALPDGRSAVEWLADVLFRPAVAMHERVFRVPNDEVLDALGIARPTGERLAGLAYVQLRAVRPTVVQLGTRYAHVDAKQRSVVETQLVDLLEHVLLFEGLLRTLDLLRDDPGGPGGGAGEALALLPPDATVDEQPRWSVPGASLGGSASPSVAALEEGLRSLVVEPSRSAAFEATLRWVHDQQRALADARGELGDVDREASLYALAPFDRAQLLFLAGLLLALLSWLGAWARRLATPARVACLAGVLLLASGIGLRCVVRGRPPVSTLYESILFVTLVCSGVGLVLARAGRRGLATALSATLGALGLALATRYETHDAADTMPSLVAVLDTNFWLATHVTTVTIGYAAGLLSSAVAHLYVFGRLLGRPRAALAPLARSVYGLVGFTLVFSLIGTILGGIWADQSWGRFWGWDPKENGALMIVLWQLVMLHGRLAGWWRDDGLAWLAMLGGVLVAFSWWGVNQLGVGLHSYGFTDGIAGALATFYAAQAAVLALAAAGLALRRRQAR